MKKIEKVKIGDLIMAKIYSQKPTKSISKTGYILQSNFVIGIVTDIEADRNSSIYQIYWADADKKDTIEDTRFLEGEVEAWRKIYLKQREIMGL